MAKKKPRGDVNKSQAVRNYLEDHPDATAGEVVPALAAKGIEVSQGLVNNVRSTLKRKGKKRVAKKPGRRGGKKGRAVKRGARSSGGNVLTVAELVEMKKVADGLGGIDQARKALDTLEELR